MADLEFVQFHPTALHVAGQPRFLLSEALRGEGARIVNADGEPFMASVDPMGDLAPRDRVARAIAREAVRTGRDVYLTMAHLDPRFVHERFPLISAACHRAGLDLATDRIPIAPAAHYVMGGVVTDLDGRTTIRGLFAAGEVACTGVNGWNRLAINSLLEGLVFGARAGNAMREARDASIDPSTVAGLEKGDSLLFPNTSRKRGLSLFSVRDLMTDNVGLFRDARGLDEAVVQLDDEWNRMIDRVDHETRTLGTDDWEQASLVTVGRLIARAARRREESRGGHYRLDHPDRDDRHWKRRIAETRRSATR